MNRKDIVNTLLKEGFSTNTLINFTDKQLTSLHSRVIKEDDQDKVKTKLSTKTPNLKSVITDLKGKGVEDIELVEDLEVIDDKKKNKSIKKKSGILAKNNLKEWVNNLVEKEYSSFTSKNDILEMINSKVANSNKIKVPEFMTYDAISKKEAETPTMDTPTIAPSKPKTAPKVSPSIKPRTPYNPGPGKNPAPKAMGKSSSLKENKTTKRKK